MPRKHAAGTLNKDIDKKEVTKTFSTKVLCWIKLGLLEKGSSGGQMENILLHQGGEKKNDSGFRSQPQNLQSPQAQRKKRSLCELEKHPSSSCRCKRSNARGPAYRKHWETGFSNARGLNSEQAGIALIQSWVSRSDVWKLAWKTLIAHNNAQGTEKEHLVI